MDYLSTDPEQYAKETVQHLRGVFARFENASLNEAEDIILYVTNAAKIYNVNVDHDEHEPVITWLTRLVNDIENALEASVAAAQSAEMVRVFQDERLSAGEYEIN